MKYETSNMGNAAFLKSLGHQIESTRSDSDMTVFVFALDPTEAQRLLNSPDRTVCAKYHQAWRNVRRLIDHSLYDVGQRI